MFQFGRLAHHKWCLRGCPIRKSSDQRFFAAPRSLSQLYTSFIASLCQGIRRVLLLSCFSERAQHAPIHNLSFLLLLLLLNIHYVKKHASTFVELAGVEPATSCLQGRRSSQLSYSPKWKVGLEGVEPSTSRLSGVRSNHLSYKPRLLCKPLRPVNNKKIAQRNKTQTALLRKEVIQPHLPVRLPCYDLAPVMRLTLDTCLPKGLAQRRQVLPTSIA